MVIVKVREQVFFVREQILKRDRPRTRVGQMMVATLEMAEHIRVLAQTRPELFISAT